MTKSTSLALCRQPFSLPRLLSPLLKRAIVVSPHLKNCIGFHESNFQASLPPFIALTHSRRLHVFANTFKHSSIAYLSKTTSLEPNISFSGVFGMWSTLVRRYSSQGLSEKEVRQRVDAITEKFIEARELLEDARAAVDTVYFDADMKDAQEAVDETLEEYDQLLQSLSSEQRPGVVRTIGLKMAELKSQQEMIKESLH